jgi:hypothetical protein
MHVTDGMSAKAANGLSTPRTAATLRALAEKNMTNGKPDEPLLENDASNVHPDHVTFAKWLLSSEKCLEVMLVSSDLPTVATTDNEAELDSGVWFMCRVDTEFLGETIMRFIRREAAP